ncbi:hypothetical protein NQ314_012640, partial [Rhamnusium bicolor]
NNIRNDTAEEVQNAICTITTKEIEASANATITRQLKGVCTSTSTSTVTSPGTSQTDPTSLSPQSCPQPEPQPLIDMDLETDDTLPQKSGLSKRDVSVQAHPVRVRSKAVQYELNIKIDKLQTKIIQEIDGIKYILEINGFKIPEAITLKNTPMSDHQDYNKSSINKVENMTNVLVRTEEILMYNNTVMDSPDSSKYFYYWKIQNIRELLAKTDMYKSSPDFFLLGHTLHLQLYPNHLENNYFGIQLRPYSSSFLKKHKIIILNQLNFGSDIDSGVLHGRINNKIFRISEKNLAVEGFIVENSLIVKLEIFVNS